MLHPAAQRLNGSAGRFFELRRDTSGASSARAGRSTSVLPTWTLVLPVDATSLCAPVVWAPEHAKGSLAMAALSLALLHAGGSYRPRLHISVLDELPVLLARLLTSTAIVATAFALRHEQTELPGFLVTSLTVIGFVIGGRVLTSQIILFCRRRRIVVRKAIIVGGGVQGAELVVLLNSYPQYGLLPIGFVADGDRPGAVFPVRCLGRVDDLDEVATATSAEVIIVSDGDIAESRLQEVLHRPGCAGRDLVAVPRLHSFRQTCGPGDHIGGLPVIRLRTPVLSGPATAIKRAVDVAVSLLLLVALLPVLAVCALAVRIEGGPGVLFRQERVGRGSQRFICLKFRSMRPASGIEGDTLWSIADDDRVGPVGRLMRRTGLDELPQLWNIVRGDMTLVGPRPERPLFVDQFSQVFPDYGRRHRVRAGLTGLAQVSGLRGDVPIGDRARFDNYYIENWSLWLDAKVVLRTFAEVFFARGR